MPTPFDRILWRDLQDLADLANAKPLAIGMKPFRFLGRVHQFNGPSLPASLATIPDAKRGDLAVDVTARTGWQLVLDDDGRTLGAWLATPWLLIRDNLASLPPPPTGGVFAYTLAPDTSTTFEHQLYASRYGEWEPYFGWLTEFNRITSAIAEVLSANNGTFPVAGGNWPPTVLRSNCYVEPPGNLAYLPGTVFGNEFHLKNHEIIYEKDPARSGTFRLYHNPWLSVRPASGATEAGFTYRIEGTASVSGSIRWDGGSAGLITSSHPGLFGAPRAGVGGDYLDFSGTLSGSGEFWLNHPAAGNFYLIGGPGETPIYFTIPVGSDLSYDGIHKDFPIRRAVIDGHISTGPLTNAIDGHGGVPGASPGGGVPRFGIFHPTADLGLYFIETVPADWLGAGRPYFIIGNAPPANGIYSAQTQDVQSRVWPGVLASGAIFSDPISDGGVTLAARAADTVQSIYPTQPKAIFQRALIQQMGRGLLYLDAIDVWLTSGLGPALIEYGCLRGAVFHPLGTINIPGGQTHARHTTRIPVFPTDNGDATVTFPPLLFDAPANVRVAATYHIATNQSAAAFIPGTTARPWDRGTSIPLSMPYASGPLTAAHYTTWRTLLTLL